MQPRFGWTLLSKDALRRAETQLRDDVDGVRDEIGFLALHQAYADRFFPGTSVLHTRLRYVLFVPWMYEKVAHQYDRQQVSAAIEKQELELTRRLKQSGEFGIIGTRSYPNPTDQPPSLIYWAAMGAWRILQATRSGSIPSRQTVHRVIGRRPIRQQLHDDDKQLLTEEDPIFVSLPKPPAAWNEPAESLTFQLEAPEAMFLRKCLLSVARPGNNGAQSLFANLVDRRVEIKYDLELWSRNIRAVADEPDREALQRARQASALAAIGRGVYAALVEKMRDQHDGIPTEDVHRALLGTIIDEFATNALALKVDNIAIDAPNIPAGILEILRATQQWLRSGVRSPEALADAYQRVESRRKGSRARLSKTLTGRERRAEWVASEHPTAKPLHYRWKKVRQLLLDLQNGA